MKILITNDDGIHSPALLKLAEWARKLGDVTVVAPKVEQSGKSQAIDFCNAVEALPVELPIDCKAWYLDSTPVDCVRFAVRWLKGSYDLVLSGINIGYNLGCDIAHSGTVGAIFEAGRIGIKAIAVSSDFTATEAAARSLDMIYDYITEERLLEHADILNVNVPSVPPRGISITRQGGKFFTDDYAAQGNNMYLQTGELVGIHTSDISTDVNAISNDFISITPLSPEYTDAAAFELLRDRTRKF